MNIGEQRKTECSNKKETIKKSKLDFLKQFDLAQGLTEWGAPHGQMARWFPAWWIGQSSFDCLWVMDRQDIQMYPPAWRDIGVNLSRIHFLYEEKPLKSFKSLVHDNPFSLLVLDCQQFLNNGDLNFFNQLIRQNHKPCFLIRHFYLSHRNGNPFARHRFNSFYHFLSHELKVTSLKGRCQGQSFFVQMKQEFL